MTHYSQVPDSVFRQLKHGHKLIEPRLYDDAHKRIKISDLIIVVNTATKEQIVTKVVGVLRYKTFDELFAAFPPRYFGAEDISDILKQVRSWYSSTQEAEHGVLGIKLHVFKTNAA